MRGSTIEILEPRRLMSHVNSSEFGEAEAFVFPASPATLFNGRLYVGGTSRADDIVVTRENSPAFDSRATVPATDGTMISFVRFEVQQRAAARRRSISLPRSRNLGPARRSPKGRTSASVSGGGLIIISSHRRSRRFELTARRAMIISSSPTMCGCQRFSTAAKETTPFRAAPAPIRSSAVLATMF